MISEFNLDECVMVKVPELDGTMLPVYKKYCRENFGSDGQTWICCSFVWNYFFYFVNPEHATLFSLKWANVQN